MKLLDRYLQTAILQGVGVVGVAVAALVLVAGFVSKSSDLGQGQFGVLQLLAEIFLMLPGHLLLVLPIIVLLGSLLALGGLAAGSELVIIRTSGVSITRLAWSVARAGLILAIIAILLGEVLGPAGLRMGSALHERAENGQTLVQSAGQGLWLREGQSFIRIGSVLSTTQLLDVLIYRLDKNGGLAAVIQANDAKYTGAGWQLHGVVVTQISPTAVHVEKSATQTWNIRLPPQVLKLSIIDPDELNTLGLLRYIDYLHNNHVSDTQYRIALWNKLVTPFTVLMLTLLALPFSFGALRSTGAGQRLFIGGLAGLIFFMFDQVSVSAGVVYGLPIWLSAALPTIVLAVIFCWWLKRVR